MTSPPLVHYNTEEEYREHFRQIYCRAPIFTFDDIPVYFRKEDFDHCMYESSKRDSVKDVFSKQRAERIDWIKETLINPNADLYQGWDKETRSIQKDRRVAVAFEEFVVVIRIWYRKDGSLAAKFLTSYLADESIEKIRSAPKWSKI
jgi:hypothetical protein